jgi:hypothetical protein
MVALGAANLASGLFQGVPVSASASRTPVAETAGAKTQLAAVIGALAVAGLLLWAPTLLAPLPMAALAAVVIASALALFELRDLRRIWRIQRWEFWLSIGCTAGVAVLGPITGIGLAILIAGDRVPLGRLAAALGGARPRRRDQGLPRHRPLSDGARRARAWCCSAGTRRSSSPTPSSSATARSRRSPIRRPGCAGSSSAPSR